MNLKLRGALGKLAHKKGMYSLAIAVVAVAVVISTGFARRLADTHAGSTADPIVTTMKPVSESTIAPLVALDRATEAVAERVIPSVVEIRVAGETHPKAGRRPDPRNIPAPFRQFFQFGPFGMQPRSQSFEALGTGLIISPDGYIVTNNHVVANTTTVHVILHNQDEYTAKVVGTDKATDLAVIKIDAHGLTSAAWGDSSQLKPGQTVLAIGDPMGMNFSVTRGIVSAVNRARTMGNGPDARGTFIQTDAAINHGNSGGPLVDIRGQVVGINSEMLTSSGASAGIGFAIPSNIVKRVATELIEHGKVVRGYLGIMVSNLLPNEADSLNEPGAQGALVSQVNNASPAAKAGIEPFDVITSFNGHKITSSSDLQLIAGEAAPGSTAHIEVLRNGKKIPMTVTMGNLANANGSSPEEASTGNNATPQIGITTTPLTPDIRGELQVPNNVNGVVVESVDPGSPAMMAGVSRGDIIEQVNRHPISTTSELQHQLQMAPKGKSILLLVYNRSGSLIVPVTPQD